MMMSRVCALALIIACYGVLITADPVPSLPGFGPLVEPTWSGYVPTTTGGGNQTRGQIFYVYFSSRSSTPDTDPVVLWLQGGPGCSGFLGLFTELGPYHLQADGTLLKNPYSWNTNAHLVFFDQPIGTGYSATNNISQIVTDEATMGIDGYNALLSFFATFPDLLSHNFYIAGESYAGKYIPYLATQITQGNDAGQNPTINLKGLLIGDGWTDPLAQTQVYSDQAYNLGLIDENEKDYVDNKLFPDCQAQTLAQNWSAAQVSCDGLLAWIVNASGGINEDDVREFGGDDKDNRLVTYLNNPAVLSALHVPAGTVWSECNGTVAQYLSTDEMKTAVHLLPDLFARYRVLLYNGQFDMNCGVVGTQLYMSQLMPTEYHAAKKRYWTVGTESFPAGYVRDITSNVSMLVVSGAGHLVPKTQPVHALDMLSRIINNIPF